jgi:hypothetical protein
LDWGCLVSERNAFQLNAQETKKRNNALIEQLKKDNKDLKKKRDEMMQNKKAMNSQGFSKTATTSGFFDNRDLVSLFLSFGKPKHSILSRTCGKKGLTTSRTKPRRRTEFFTGFKTN